jgi:3-oxoacyl-[acyl-carrier protein] reductase
MINQEKMLRAKDIAVAIHFLLTQPIRTVVQSLIMVPRVEDE